MKEIPLRALITGGAGFIGSHLAEDLLERGDEVFIIDNLTTGSVNNIKHLRSNPRFHYTIDNIMNEPILAELIDQIDIVFHLAAAVGVKLIVESPVNTIETNIQGTEVVLTLANKKKKKVVVASTSEVYGKNQNLPFCEDADLVLGSTDKGRWSYACSKAIDEFLSLAYYKEKKLPTIILRYFNTVGPRQTGQYGMVLPTFVRQALLGHPITVFGDGTQSRCFGFVKDVTAATIALAEHDDAVGQIFNIGNDQEVTMEELASMVREMTGSESEIVHVPYDKAYEEGFEDMQRRVPDLSKIRETIGYTPKVDLPGIIQSVIDYFKM